MRELVHLFRRGSKPFDVCEKRGRHTISCKPVGGSRGSFGKGRELV